MRYTVKRSFNPILHQQNTSLKLKHYFSANSKTVGIKPTKTQVNENLRVHHKTNEKLNIVKIKIEKNKNSQILNDNKNFSKNEKSSGRLKNEKKALENQTIKLVDKTDEIFVFGKKINSKKITQKMNQRMLKNQTKKLRHIHKSLTGKLKNQSDGRKEFSTFAKNVNEHESSITQNCNEDLKNENETNQRLTAIKELELLWEKQNKNIEEEKLNNIKENMEERKEEIKKNINKKMLEIEKTKKFTTMVL